MDILKILFVLSKNKMNFPCRKKKEKEWANKFNLVTFIGRIGGLAAGRSESEVK